MPVSVERHREGRVPQPFLDQFWANARFERVAGERVTEAMKRPVLEPGAFEQSNPRPRDVPETAAVSPGEQHGIGPPTFRGPNVEMLAEYIDQFSGQRDEAHAFNQSVSRGLNQCAREIQRRTGEDV
jgi:hypothetical protein